MDTIYTFIPQRTLKSLVVIRFRQNSQQLTVKEIHEEVVLVVSMQMGETESERRHWADKYAGDQVISQGLTWHQGNKGNMVMQSSGGQCQVSQDQERGADKLKHFETRRSILGSNCLAALRMHLRRA